MAQPRDSSPNLRDPSYTPLKDVNEQTISPTKPRVKSGVRASTAKKLTARTHRSRRVSPSKNDTQSSIQASKNQMNLNYGMPVTLNDPTSVTMQNSFLIKNHHSANFEAYLLMMKKRKNTDKVDPMNTTINRDSDSPQLQ